MPPPGGRRNGLISHLHPATLGAAVVDRLTKKVGQLRFLLASVLGMPDANIAYFGPGMDGALVDD
eukprot:3092067-Rhodomonas_salina.1